MSEFSVGATIGNYRILGELGRGGMGIVYKATDLSLHRIVALKVLPAHFSHREEFLQRFRQEARAVAQLNHPNVVTLYQIGEHDGSNFIAMEFVEGRELDTMIAAQGRLTPDLAFSIARQIAAALEAAHAVGIIHRDIKPQNIMVADDGRARVMDFGVAKLEAAVGTVVTSEGLLMGTPAYMAPEQFKLEEIDARADLYALGVVIYVCLTGRVPFEGDTPASVMYRVLNDDPIPVASYNPLLPPAVCALLDRSLAKNPADRFQSARELRDAIDAIDPAQLKAAVPPPAQTTQIMIREELPDARPATPSAIPGGLLEFGAWFWARPPRTRLAMGAGAAALLLFLLVLASRPSSEADDTASMDVGTSVVQLERVGDGARAPLSPALAAPVTREELREAIALYSGAAGRVDEAHVRSVLDRAVAHGDPLGLMWSAWFHQGGRCGIESQPQRALELAASSFDAVRHIAGEGDPDAVFLLGVAYAEGLGTSPSPEAGLTWVTRAADAAHPLAMTYLGDLHQEGRGVPANAAQALLWYQRAAAAGDVGSMNRLGRLYLVNSDVPGADAIAVRWFRQAAELGSPSSMTRLAWMYQNGRGVPADDAEAIRWYRDAARLGDTEAEAQLRHLTGGA